MAVPELRPLAEQAVEKFDDVEAAVSWVRSALADDEPLMSSCLDAMIAVAIRAEIHDVRDSMRLMAKQPDPPQPTKRGPDIIIATALGVQRMILDTWRVGNKRLGDLTKAELTTEAAAQSSLAYGHSINATFYATLAKRMRADDVVRDKFSHTQARALLLKAKNST